LVNVAEHHQGVSQPILESVHTLCHVRRLIEVASLLPKEFPCA
jgi:hypothetical protein